MKKLKKQIWRDTGTTLKSSLKSHKRLIELSDDKKLNLQFISEFKNEYGERFAVFKLSNLSQMYIAGDETGWELKLLVEVYGSFEPMASSDLFLFSKKEKKKLLKIIYEN